MYNGVAATFTHRTEVCVRDRQRERERERVRERERERDMLAVNLALTIIKPPCIILPFNGHIDRGTLFRSVVTTTRTCLHSIQGTVHSGMVDR